MGEAGLEACAGFLAGGAAVRPLVGGAGSWPSGGLGPCVGASPEAAVGSLVFSLFAGGWGYVLTYLIVWPEVFRHWRLQAVRWC